tara:strand:- start:23 stop:472 length:450 start_codon:yes stop_codon:yes gene_type:complete
MFKSIQKFFDDNLDHKDSPSLGSQALGLAASAILFEVARADFEFDPKEQQKLSALISDQFKLSSDETAELLSLAEKEADDSPGLYEFTNLINQHWTMEERIRLIENMWEIVYVDNRLDDNEQHLMRRVQNLLHVPHRDYIAAKLKHKTP